ncbi:hypothetical protein [Pseudobacteroides cellulosolvens]|uniref:Uncharacterized protein n=1 Tax=Pseudobacteroides cellulosolvens ATCC 35603 = DSM 2933 TaxID=398512 RepID=A0A0L6JK67_9FIRM|nr:hypothetical protein [Pseudobacteroides cellulosolvens]KNY26174.1 hypothetical protein Bccel_1436 [Pseudobacteroides cellulosolvens ATCC 35603 = DSM 2933]
MMRDLKQKCERSELALELLLELQEVLKGLSEIALDMEKNSNTFYKEYFNNNLHLVQSDIDNYTSNNGKIKKLKLEVTALVNDWFSFKKDTKETKKLTFPIKLYLTKKHLKNKIKELNESISNTNIENRFIKEKLISWEHELGIECIKAMKSGEDFSHYEKLLRLKKELMDELKYILPTIPGVCPLELDLQNIDRFIEEFKSRCQL